MSLRSLASLLTAVTLVLTLFSCGPQVESPSSVLSSDGVPIHYEVHGSGEPALVLVHGWSCDRSYWDAQVQHFSEQHLVVTIDLAGHGESGLGREVWSMSAFGQDVASVVEDLGLEQVILVGHSMGGPVVVEAARVLGDRVRGVVGADTFNDLSVKYSPEEVEAFVQPFRANFSEAVGAVVRTMFVPTSDPAIIERTVSDMASGPVDVGVGAFEEMIAWYNVESEVAFRELDAPVRLVNSDYQPTNVDAGRGLTGSFDAVFMSGVGHFVMTEDPETFNRLLEEVLEEIRGTS
ncbi:MAG: alpha/beta hydrolase [Gemmatimonadetes bacterium]|nr:alpha/beta hydrolase [Gemmatimonadota bacterium]